MIPQPKDERLVLIGYKSAYHAYLTYFLVSISMIVVRMFVQSDILDDPNFLLVVPMMISAGVMTFFLIHDGYYKTVREELSRNEREMRRAWTRFALGVLLFFVLMFLENYFNLLDSEPVSTTEALVDSAIVTVIWGFFMWFVTVRRVKPAENEDDDE